VLAIALVPTLLLLVGSLSFAAYQLNSALGQRSWAGTFARFSTDAAIPYLLAEQDERRVSMLAVSGSALDRAALGVQRQRTDGVAAAFAAGSARLANNDADPDIVNRINKQYRDATTTLNEVRGKIDNGLITVRQVYDAYNGILDVDTASLGQLAAGAPDARSALEQVTISDLFHVADGMARSSELLLAGVQAGGLQIQDFKEYVQQVGGYHSLLDTSKLILPADILETYRKIQATSDWDEVVSAEDALIARGQTATTNVTGPDIEVPALVSPELRTSATAVANQLIDPYRQQFLRAADLVRNRANATLIATGIAVAVLVLMSAVALSLALRLSERLITRLSRLRRETLDLAGRLPGLMSRLRQGDKVDVAAEVTPLRHGSDEIGQVAEAFTTAQQAAVAAAVQEARTREGANAVFLGIAHRSQAVAHRQIKMLDEAERELEDVEQLETLFALDHLATRARRNAENLIILGGEQPARQWRRPVSLVQVVRSAIAETEHFTRIATVRIPDLPVLGAAVADLVHLLAELVDNATAFSPPEAKVAVRANRVGKGVVIEIEDQGLGIAEVDRDRINHTLAHPPDFDAITLSTDLRLGLFVVARLAARRGIKVSLRESAYGGTQAIVLLPTSLFAADLEELEQSVPAGSPLGGRDERTAALAGSSAGGSADAAALESGSLGWAGRGSPARDGAGTEGGRSAVLLEHRRNGRPVGLRPAPRWPELEPPSTGEPAGLPLPAEPGDSDHGDDVAAWSGQPGADRQAGADRQLGADGQAGDGATALGETRPGEQRDGHRRGAHRLAGPARFVSATRSARRGEARSSRPAHRAADRPAPSAEPTPVSAAAEAGPPPADTAAGHQEQYRWPASEAPVVADRVTPPGSDDAGAALSGVDGGRRRNGSNGAPARPALPRRVRQASLQPELRAEDGGDAGDARQVVPIGSSPAARRAAPGRANGSVATSRRPGNGDGSSGERRTDHEREHRHGARREEQTDDVTGWRVQAMAAFQRGTRRARDDDD
jgi:signal transduction histidine kinase